MTDKLPESMRMKVVPVCRALGHSRQSYYKERKVRQRKAVDEALIVEFVVSARIDHPRCGVRKLCVYIRDDLKRAGIKVGRDRLFEILRIHDMLVERRKAFVPHTTHWDRSLPVSRNLLADRIVDGPNQVFVADITYIRLADRFVYLSLVSDYFSKDIVGWFLADDLGHAGPVKALEMARGIVPEGVVVIHHSDRGCQYACGEFLSRLKAFGMLSSMTEELHCYENSVAERINGILKDEYYLNVEFKDKDEALKAVARAIEVYNGKRVHESLGFHTPAYARSNPDAVREGLVAIQLAAQERRRKFAEDRAKREAKTVEAA